MRVIGNAGVLVVRIEQRQVQRFRKIDREKTHRQEILGGVLIGRFRRRAGLALLRYGRKAVISRDHDVGGGRETEIVECLAQLRQIVVGILDAGQRSGTVDAGRHGVEAVTGVVLAAVGVARPEYQHERFRTFLEHRQHDFTGDVGEIGLLRDIRHHSARRLGVAGFAVVAAGGRRERKIGLGQRGLHFI